MGDIAASTVASASWRTVDRQASASAGVTLGLAYELGSGCLTQFGPGQLMTVQMYRCAGHANTHATQVTDE